jgi:uncharacterized membrane protein YphA (DoxX/SURF4 family)
MSAAAVVLIPIAVGTVFVSEGIQKFLYWIAANEARTDLSMLLASVFLPLVGEGRVSLDAFLLRDGPEGRQPSRRT